MPNSGWRANRKPTPVVIVGTEINDDVVTSTYTLLSDASSTGDWVVVAGGSYTWSAAGTFSGATLTLQSLGEDGTTAVDTGATLTATGTYADVLEIGDGTSVRVAITGGPPSGITSRLRVI